MKVLKIIEKVIFIVAVVLGVAALVFSILLDEPVVALDADDAVMPQTLGLLTLLQYGIRGSAEHGVMTPFAGYFPAAGGLVIVLLLLV